MSDTPSPPAIPNDAEQQARWDRIVAAAIELLLDSEYDKVQMKDVTAKAGVSLRTTYRYFVSKDHLFSEALLVWASDFPEPPIVDEGTDRDRLGRAYHRAVRAFEPHRSAHQTLARLQASNDPYAIANFARFAERQTAAFARCLPDVEPERRRSIIAVMSAVLDVHLRSWSLGRSPIAEVHAMIDTTADLLLP